MDALGSFSLLLAFCFSLYAIAAAAFGEWKKNPLVAQSAERAAVVTGLLTVLASSSLLVLLFRDDFRIAAVASHSNRTLPAFYKLSALWSGQEGSLLFWSAVLGAYSIAVVLLNRKSHRHLMPYVIIVMMITQAFFLLLNNFVVNPFQLLAVDTAAGTQVFAPPDGQGLNPLLQYPMMVIHPPMLYLGFVGFTIPFAFAMAALLTKSKGEKWIQITRRWTMVTWAFLTAGVMLGGRWAYAVLGWGGYWGWDPVENASLLPWLTSTAFLHSVMMQEKRGMMKVWNMVLIFTTFFLCLFGTFLTRSGVLSSVHAFAQSPIGPYFATFIMLGLAVSVVILLRRLDFLKSENHLDSLLSRESSFLFNNLILLAATFAILWGTMFPLISEAVQGVKITVGAPYFNKIVIPIGLFLMLLTGLGPLFAWRKTSMESLRRNFAKPVIVAAIITAAFIPFGLRGFFAIMTIFLSLFVIATIMEEFYRGARALKQKHAFGWMAATGTLTLRNTRRYGGYVVHFGMALLFIGFAGNAFNIDKQQEMAAGDEMTVGNYRFVLEELVPYENDNYVASSAKINVFDGDTPFATMYPQRRVYKVGGQPTTEVAIKARLSEDVYLVFAGMSEDGQRAVIHAYINPLVMWVWIGTIVTLLGTLLALAPNQESPRASPPATNATKETLNESPA